MNSPMTSTSTSTSAPFLARSISSLTVPLSSNFHTSVSNSTFTCSTNSSSSQNVIKDKIYGPLTLHNSGIPNVGDYATLPHAFSHDHLLSFAKLSGDDNPMHFDDTFASQQGK